MMKEAGYIRVRLWVTTLLLLLVVWLPFPLVTASSPSIPHSEVISVQVDASTGNVQTLPHLDSTGASNSHLDMQPHANSVTDTTTSLSSYTSEPICTPTAQDTSTATPTAPDHYSIWTGECGLWLAPSTLEGAGLGMYAGLPFAAHQDFQVTGDVVIPIVDLAHHAALHTQGYHFLWDQYTWGPEGLLMHWDGHFIVKAASPGFGSAANSFLPLVNVQEQSDLHIDAAGLHRSTDPGVGAFTIYHHRRSTATQDIVVGQELFVDYGAEWFQARPQLGPIPLMDDLDKAHDLVRAYHILESRNISPDALHDAWDMFVRHSLYKDSRVLGAFHHDNPHELELFKDRTVRQLRVEQSIRSLEWLQQHGTCADHIHEGPSTLRQAGRGAMAARYLPTGTVVAHMPLIHITDRSLLDMFAPTGDENGNVVIDHSTPIGQQLLLNYCYGHNESTLLLCPYGPMVNLINHNQTQANVALQWADPWRGNHMPDLLEHPLEELEHDATAKLAMELVAIRDIQPGEEVFLDYGDAWEAAWQHQVRTWKPASALYTSAETLNASPMRVRTEFEQIDQPYPSNIGIQCSWHFTDTDRWRRLYYEEGERFILMNDYYPCEVLRYEEVDDDIDEYIYTIVITKQEDDNELINYLVEDVPRLAIRFVDAPYSIDMFLSNAFRHSIGIPDEIFPSAWRNLRVNNDGVEKEG
jgi:hypothetical protein